VKGVGAVPLGCTCCGSWLSWSDRFTVNDRVWLSTIPTGHGFGFGRALENQAAGKDSGRGCGGMFPSGQEDFSARRSPLPRSTRCLSATVIVHPSSSIPKHLSGGRWCRNPKSGYVSLKKSGPVMTEFSANRSNTNRHSGHSILLLEEARVANVAAVEPTPPLNKRAYLSRGTAKWRAPEQRTRGW